MVDLVETYEPCFKELGAHPDTAFVPSIESTSTKTLFQGIRTSLQSLSSNLRTLKSRLRPKMKSAPDWQPLSTDATMVDLTIYAPPFA